MHIKQSPVGFVVPFMLVMTRESLAIVQIVAIVHIVPFAIKCYNCISLDELFILLCPYHSSIYNFN